MSQHGLRIQFFFSERLVFLLVSFWCPLVVLVFVPILFVFSLSFFVVLCIIMFLFLLRLLHNVVILLIMRLILGLARRLRIRLRIGAQRVKFRMLFTTWWRVASICVAIGRPYTFVVSFQISSSCKALLSNSILSHSPAHTCLIHNALG